MRSGTSAIGLATLGITEAPLFLDAEWLHGLLKTYIKASKMTPIGTHRIQVYPGRPPGGCNGITILQPLKESHASLETYPESGLVELMISSCRVFDASVFPALLEPYGTKVVIVDTALFRRNDEGWLIKDVYDKARHADRAAK